MPATQDDVNHRSYKRASDQMRPVNVEYGIFESAPGSVLLNYGKTRVLCAVTLQQGVPSFARGTGNGWLTAEYAMLPAATMQRTLRESSSFKRNGRSVEIARLIGRSLRATAELSALGERTVIIDCDVLQADGGTRTASITAASLALLHAQERWLADGTIEKPVITDPVCAVAVGICNDQILLDPDYQEDCQLTADFNMVMTTSGELVEMQGGGEQGTVSWKTFEQVRLCALKGAQYLREKLFAQDAPQVMHGGSLSRSDATQDTL